MQFLCGIKREKRHKHNISKFDNETCLSGKISSMDFSVERVVSEKIGKSMLLVALWLTSIECGY